MTEKKRNRSFPHQLFNDIQAALGHPPDLISRCLLVREEQPVQCVYLESMVAKKTIDDYILKSITEHTFSEGQAPRSSGSDFLRELSFSNPYKTLLEQSVQALLAGYCVLTDVAGGRVLLLNVTEPKQRSIEESKSELTIRGPHEGFTESILTNVGLIRNRIRNPSLRFEKMSVGSQTETTLLMVYMENLAPNSLVREMRNRLKAIRTDSVLESAYVEEFIQDRIWTPFPTMSNTERPDVMAAQLLDGKVAVMVNGTPSVLLAPMTFFEFFSSPEIN